MLTNSESIRARSFAFFEETPPGIPAFRTGAPSAAPAQRLTIGRRAPEQSNLLLPTVDITPHRAVTRRGMSGAAWAPSSSRPEPDRIGSFRSPVHLLAA